MTITVSALNIYPVKSLGGIALAESLITTRGFQFDRRFMLVDARDVFVTQREHPKLATVWVDLVGDEIELAAPDRDPMRFPATPSPLATRTVAMWDGHARVRAVSAEADRWLTDFLGSPAHLVYMPDTTERLCSSKYAKNGEIVSFADGYPFLLTSEASLANLNRRIAKTGAQKVPMNRFRPNIVVAGMSAWEEDKWLNRTFAIGDATFQAVKPCRRCPVTTTDQVTGDVLGPEPLRTLATFRIWRDRVVFGMNLVPVKRGVVRVGDSVRML